MIRAIHKRLENRDEGFTLIELLVVVIIIGILAAIAIPTFLNQRERGWEAQAQSDLRNLVIAMESCSVPQGGAFTGCDTTLAANGFRQSVGVTSTPTVAGAPSLTFTATSKHANSPAIFNYNSATGLIVRAAATP